MNHRKQRLRKKVILAMLAVMMCLPGCGHTIVYKEQNVEDGAISGQRTGAARQGLSTRFNSTEVTDERVYFMTNIAGVPTLYYCMHGSDQVAPLCTKSGCNHRGKDCEACFPANGNVCYYDGYLYVDSDHILYRLNPDGSNREVVLDIWEKVDGDYNGISDTKLWNGIFTFYMTKMVMTEDLNWNQNEQKCYDPYYFRLDGTMEKPEPMDNLITQYNDGSNFIMRGPAEEGTPEEWLLYTWDAQENISELRCDYTEFALDYYTPLQSVPDEEIATYDEGDVLRRYEAFSEGYWGAECAYFLLRERNEKGLFTDNVICKYDYAENTTQELIRTGLSGVYRLLCFPDCLVLVETATEVSIWGNSMAYAPKLYFYNWDFQLVGQYDFTSLLGEADYLQIYSQDIICGETVDRIYISVRFLGVPEYYIDKSDFGGEIRLHKLRYAGIDLDEAAQQILSTDPQP